MNQAQPMYIVNSDKRGRFDEFAGTASVKKLLFTGATSDIGQSLLREFTSIYPQMEFILASRNGSHLLNLVKKFDEETKARIQITNLPNSTLEMPTFVKDIQGIDSAIICQGTYGVLGHLKEVNLEGFLKSLFSQLESVIITLRALLELESQELKVIVLGGGGASQAYEGLSEYGMAKTAIARLVETIGLELSPEKFAINFLGPGPTYSPMVEDVLVATSESVKIDHRIVESSKKLKSNTPGISKNLINACEYLLSDSCSRISGKFISSNWDSPKQLSFLSDDNSFTLRRVIPVSQIE